MKPNGWSITPGWTISSKWPHEWAWSTPPGSLSHLGTFPGLLLLGFASCSCAGGCCSSWAEPAVSVCTDSSSGCGSLESKVLGEVPEGGRIQLKGKRKIYEHGWGASASKQLNTSLPVACLSVYLQWTLTLWSLSLNLMAFNTSCLSLESLKK